MNNCEEKIPTASSTPTPVVQDTRCYTIEDLMAMLILSRPTVCLTSSTFQEKSAIL